jgi:hypothetical protein
MMFSPVRRALLTYLTESQASDGTTKRAIIVESRPEYAVLQLEGTNIRYSVAWERVLPLLKRTMSGIDDLKPPDERRSSDERRRANDRDGLGQAERRMTRIQAGRRGWRSRTARSVPRSPSRRRDRLPSSDRVPSPGAGFRHARRLARG